jgi:hypothetical protein
MRSVQAFLTNGAGSTERRFIALVMSSITLTVAMDRITHAHYVQDLRPLELVARANLAITLIGNESPRVCVDLLERG